MIDLNGRMIGGFDERTLMLLRATLNLGAFYDQIFREALHLRNSIFSSSVSCPSFTQGGGTGGGKLV